MKRTLALIAVLLPLVLVYVHANAKTTQAGYEPATVVSVDKRASYATSIDSPTDAPLQSETYSYDIGIRLNCNVYIGRYESAIDYLPSVFAPNHKVDVRLEKHLMYVSLPETDRIVKMGIVSHKHLKDNACPANG